MPEVIGSFLFDERHGWVSLSGAELIATEDGARSWRTIYPSGALEADAVPFSEMVFTDKERGLALYAHLGRGQLYKTNNAGKTWSPIFTEVSFSALARVPGSRFVIAVSRDSIYSLTARQE